MKSKNVIIFVLVVLGLLGLMWWSKPTQTQTLGSNPGVISNSVLTAEEKFYDFGAISMAQGNVAKTFKITNPTNEDIILKTVTTSCMCTTTYIGNARGEKGPFGMPGHGGPAARANEVIRAGESRNIRVVYDPAAHGLAGVGPVERFIYLEEATGGVLELKIKAMVTP